MPGLRKQVRWVPENTFRPFCSARCKQMDLGAWAAERYRIGGTDEEPSPDAEPEGGSGRHD